jgi:hypothetical protein
VAAVVVAAGPVPGLDVARPVEPAVWHRAWILLLRAPEEVHAEVRRQRLALRHRQADAVAMLPLTRLQHPLGPLACCS